MKIIVLGSTGMLGRYVFNFFKNKDYQVIGVSREQFSLSKNSHKEEVELFFDSLNLLKNDVVINCIGLIKPQVDKYGIELSLIVNSLFPNILANYCLNRQVKMIHVTTDCVFSGSKGMYTEDDIHDVFDTYGRTKSLGEPNNCTVIRTSIIGEEVNQSRSLVEWIKSNSGKTINGYDDHLWNGITCLQFAKIAEEIISKNIYWSGVKHIYSNIVSKYQLLCLINHVYNLSINIVKTKSNNKCDRTLFTNKEVLFNIPNLETQIDEMKKFYAYLK